MSYAASFASNSAVVAANCVSSIDANSGPIFENDTDGEMLCKECESVDAQDTLSADVVENVSSTFPDTEFKLTRKLASRPFNFGHRMSFDL